ncbi:hypothetical protein KCU85_g466, partial [Aureobasidium melanogenum]
LICASGSRVLETGTELKREGPPRRDVRGEQQVGAPLTPPSSSPIATRGLVLQRVTQKVSEAVLGDVLESLV